jgi:F-type H+-transporting ATPase subunit delta
LTDRTIARRYARALFELALEQKAEDAVVRDLQSAMGKLAASREVAASVFDPRTERGVRRDAATKLLPPTAHPLARDFVGFMVDRGREQLLPVATEELGALLRDHRGEAEAEVVSAAPLDDEARRALAAKLGEVTGRKITLKESVDATLLGGVRVKVGSMLLDGSVKRRLDSLRDELRRVPLPAVNA